MKSILLLLFISCVCGLMASAQSDNGSQTLTMTTGNSVEITFTSNNSATGGLVSLPFTTADDYANGVASSDQQIKVSSNKAFNVAVKASSANFSYSGNTTPAPSMPVNGILKVMVPANSTG